jgi:hypothetical protein
MTEKYTSDQDDRPYLIYQWDVFISHATEDKLSTALPLAQKLEERGLRVWIDKNQIDLADNLRGKVNQGISKSRFGVVILTSHYFDKKWTIDELDAFMAREESGIHVVVPIVHEIEPEKIKEKYPLIANRVFSKTTKGLDSVADDIVRIVLKYNSGSPSQEIPTIGRRFLNLLESTSNSSEVRQFLGHHSNIIIRAIGGDSKSTIKLSPNLNDFIPDFCVSNFLPTPSRHEWYIILLNSLSSQLFLNESEPISSIQKVISDMNLLRSWMETHYSIVRELLPDITSEFHGIIVAGRRQAFSDDEKQKLWLDEYNDMLFGIRIRTYDWLVDAALRI